MISVPMLPIRLPVGSKGLYQDTETSFSSSVRAGRPGLIAKTTTGRVQGQNKGVRRSGCVHVPTQIPGV